MSLAGEQVSDTSRARAQALDVTRSFIVQAPAGSGKTELLIQRYLALLAHVDLPEQIVAITFTRKAAAEMRRRVLGALAAAATDASPTEPHRAKTHLLATAALERARTLSWGLDLQPQRLLDMPRPKAGRPRGSASRPSSEPNARS